MHEINATFGSRLFHTRSYWRKKGEKLRIHSQIEHCDIVISGPAPAKFDIFVFNYLRKTAQK